jgi:hypothetical protein
MRHKFLVAPVAVALAFAGVSCGGKPLSDSGTGGTSGSGGSVGSGGAIQTSGGEPLTAFAEDFTMAACAPQVICGAFSDLFTCRAAVDFEQSSLILTAMGEVARGTVIYDPAAAAACIADVPQDCTATVPQMRGVSPGELFQMIPACAGVFTGTLFLGAACELYSFSCAGTNLCLPGSSNCTMQNGCCLGNCQPYDLHIHQLGESCTDNGLCQAPSICKTTCVLPPAEGAACDAWSNPCGRFADYCRTDGTGTAGTCVPRLSVGTACTLSGPSGQPIDPCQLDAHCADDGTGNGVSHCVAYASLEAACDSTNPCDPLLVCTNGVCVAQDFTGVDCGD